MTKIEIHHFVTPKDITDASKPHHELKKKKTTIGSVVEEKGYDGDITPLPPISHQKWDILCLMMKHNKNHMAQPRNYLSQKNYTLNILKPSPSPPLPL